MNLETEDFVVIDVLSELTFCRREEACRVSDFQSMDIACERLPICDGVVIDGRTVIRD